MRRAGRTLAALAAILGVAASAGHAQTATMTMTASASVPTLVTVTGVRPLAFGTVLPGVPRTIAVNALTSGRFLLNGQGSANVRLVFTLPATLVAGAASMPIGSWTACRNNNNNANVGCTAFVPSGAGLNTQLHPSGAMNVFIGGTVTPTANQPGGNYVGTITLVASYI